MEQFIVKNGVADLKLVIDVFSQFDSLNLDDLLRIDYANIYGECANFPAIIAGISNLLWQARNELRTLRYNLDLYEAQHRAIIIERLTEIGPRGGLNRPSDAQVLSDIMSQVDWQRKRKSLDRAEETVDYMDKLYWAAKSKMDMLLKMSMSQNFSSIDLQRSELKQYLLLKGTKVEPQSPIVATDED